MGIQYKVCPGPTPRWDTLPSNSIRIAYYQRVALANSHSPGHAVLARVIVLYKYPGSRSPGTMSDGGGYYKYRCKYFLTYNCQNWVYSTDTACAACSVRIPPRANRVCAP